MTTLAVRWSRQKPWGFLAISAVLWWSFYQLLAPVSQVLVAVLPVTPEGALNQSLQFFFYDTPKVLLLLTGVVFVMGLVKTTPHTRPGGRRARPQPGVSPPPLLSPPPSLPFPLPPPFTPPSSAPPLPRCSPPSAPPSAPPASRAAAASWPSACVSLSPLSGGGPRSHRLATSLPE